MDSLPPTPLSSGHADPAPAAAERLLAERTAALRESEERFRSAFEHAAIGMALVGLDGRWLKVNLAVCDLLGYSEGELLATSFQTLTHPADLERDLAHVGALVAGQTRSYQMTKRYFHKAGHVVWALLSVSLVRDEAGAPLYFVSQIQDVSEQRRAEEALAARERQFRGLAQNAPVGIFQSDAEGNNIFVNERWCDMTGLSPEQSHGMGWLKALHPEDRAGVFSEWARASAAGEEFFAEYRYRSDAGRIVWAQVTATPVRDDQGQVTGYIGTSTDVTDRKRGQWLESDRRQVLELVAQDRPLREVLTRLLSLVEHQADGVRAALLMVDEGQIRMESSQSLPADFAEALRRSGLPLAAELSSLVGERGASPVTVSSIPRDRVWEPLRPIAAAAGLKTCWLSPVRTNEGMPLGLLTLFCRSDRIPSDDETNMIDMATHLATISIQHHQTTQQLDHLVRHDTLTGQPNRILFEDRLEQAMTLADRSGKRVGLMVLDLDRFKDVNDTYGHHAGDQLLVQFARRVKEALRESDTLARVGGDEFLLLLPELDDRAGAASVAEKIVAGLSAEPFDLGGNRVTVSASIGIALYPEDARETHGLKKLADAQMYRTKRAGRNGFSMAQEASPAAV